MNVKEIKKNPLVYRYAVKKHYAQHIEDQKPSFTWHEDLPELQECMEENVIIEKKIYNFTDGLVLDGNENHEVYSDSNLEEHALKGAKIKEILKKRFSLKHLEINKNIQKPGKFVAPHVDHQSGFIRRCPFDFYTNQFKRLIIFITPWQMGQVWMVGDEAITRWKPFSVLEFPWYIPHATANTSTFDRQTLSITGISNTI